MSEAFLKALKWYIMALAGVVGSSAFISANENGEVLPWIVVVLGFGVVYIMSIFWKEFRGKILLLSVIVFVGLTFVSSYTAPFLYAFLGVDVLESNEFFLWGMTMLLGIPLMTLTFRYVHDE